MDRSLVERVVRLVQDYYNERLGYEELFNQAPELESDKEFSRLLGYLEHQPGKKGIYGEDTTTEYEEHRRALFDELQRLIHKYGGRIAL